MSAELEREDEAAEAVIAEGGLDDMPEVEEDIFGDGIVPLGEGADMPPIPEVPPAGAAMDAANVPPPPGRAPARANPAAGSIDRQRPEFVCRIPELGGHILFYEKSKLFFAYCGNPGHGRCMRSRTSESSSRADRVGQGRPLGLLAAWLRGHNLPSKQEHSWDFPDHSARLAARQQWRGRSEAFATLESLERPRRPGEAEEPDIIP